MINRHHSETRSSNRLFKFFGTFRRDRQRSLLQSFADLRFVQVVQSRNLFHVTLARWNPVIEKPGGEPDSISIEPCS